MRKARPGLRFASCARDHALSAFLQIVTDFASRHHIQPLPESTDIVLAAKWLGTQIESANLDPNERHMLSRAARMAVDLQANHGSRSDPDTCIELGSVIILDVAGLLKLQARFVSDAVQDRIPTYPLPMRLWAWIQDEEQNAGWDSDGFKRIEGILCESAT